MLTSITSPCWGILSKRCTSMLIPTAGCFGWTLFGSNNAIGTTAIIAHHTNWIVTELPLSQRLNKMAQINMITSSSPFHIIEHRTKDETQYSDWKQDQIVHSVKKKIVNIGKWESRRSGGPDWIDTSLLLFHSQWRQQCPSTHRKMETLASSIKWNRKKEGENGISVNV